MSDDEKEKLCFDMFWELTPKDMRNFSNESVNSKDIVLPYPPFTDYCNSLNDHSHDQISSAVDTDLNDGMVFSEFDDGKFPVSKSVGTLPLEMPDIHSMDVDLPESDECFAKTLPAVHEDELLSNDQEFSPVSIQTCLKSAKVQCLQSIESLREKCVEEGLKFNMCDCSELYGKGEHDLQLMNCGPCIETSCVSLVEISKREVQVECLQSLEILKEICENQGLIFNASDTNKTNEVDIIYTDKLIDDDTYYFIKWKNCTTASNTWEPSWHLGGCSDMIEFYHAMRSSRKKLNKNLLTYFVHDLISRKPYDILTLTKVCALCFDTSEKQVRLLKLTISQMKSKVKEILMFQARKLKNIEDKLFNIMKYGETRKQVLISLKEWECDINAVNSESAYVAVENHVDLETSPSGFQFVQDYINTVSSRRAEPVTFCSCEENCYDRKDFCCPNDSDGKFAYNQHKRLILEPGYPIFECNDRCNCPQTCINRVVQHGPKVKVAIFRTRGKGWGLKALENIEKGQFVLEYLGEIITSDVAEARGHIYDYVGRSYLFDLDYGIDNVSCCYTVDAGHVGNVSHFINHSCDPNLHVFAVWINEQDPCLPRLAFFAKRNVEKGEELTFDYKMSKDRFGDDSSVGENDRILCRCNSKKCRKYLF